MIHNKRECGAAKRAFRLGIPHCHIKAADEDQIIQLFKAWRVDLIVLAGWMRVISPAFIEAFPEKIINLHPSLLPKYKGLHAIEQALDSKDKVTGCTVHFVNEELDGGAIIKQQEVPILPDDDIKTLTKRIQRAEYGLLPDVINSI
jgi:formyltetrahydrofolate-dependent phosphoribosylglycinamide formyltransferase|tara:strand:- start:438 stop:875 length:438 start_codon:yes stop_codon:yes gene_type:complete